MQTPENIFDGIVGINFLKELEAKIIINFDNMKIEEVTMEVVAMEQAIVMVNCRTKLYILCSHIYIC